ncbi:MAG: hypothetical protein HC933_23200 [Pleurocapsa sp. SU_196_0]|nr:hypothetical protein [Pleurocapsa sp. SU_196_0]
MTNHTRLEKLHSEALTHANLRFVRTHRAQELHRVLRSLYHLTLEVFLGAPQTQLSR